MSLNSNIKKFIEENIDLIDLNDLQALFAKALEEFSFPSVYMDMLMNVLETSGIATVAQSKKIIKQIQENISIEELSLNIPGLQSFKGDNSNFIIEIEDDQSRYDYVLLGTLNNNMYDVTLLQDYKDRFGYHAIRSVYTFTIAPKRIVTLINRIHSAYTGHRGTANELSVSFILKGFNYTHYTLFSQDEINRSKQQFGV